MLTQAQADFLARVAKQLANTTVLALPTPGQRSGWEAVSRQGSDTFRLDMSRGTIAADKITLQERYKVTEILFRLDISGPPHTNPDGQIIPTPHLHMYRRGHNDKWAFAIPNDLDISSGDPVLILHNFFQYCGVDPVPPIQQGVFP